jgi:pilus assembly protein CpaB
MLMVIGGALLAAIVVALMVQVTLGGKKKGGDAGPEVLVANKTLLTGEILRPDDTHWEHFPDNAIFKGMIKRKDQTDEKKLAVYNKLLRRSVESGEPITTQTVVTDADSNGNFLAASIAPGMRAMSIPVKADVMTGGFVTPGDHVDVIMTYQLSMKGDAAKYAAAEIQKYASETVLSNVRVLAVDQNAKEASHNPKVGRTVTVEVSKEGAQILAMAAKMGALTLSLRRLGEKDAAVDMAMPLTTDVRTSRVIQKIYGDMNKSQTESDTVRIYDGATVINMPVRAVAEDAAGE